MSRRSLACDDVVSTLSLSAGNDFVETPAVKALARRALSYLEAGFPLHLRGPAGSGKTTLAFRLATALAKPAMFLAGDESLVTADLIGKQSRLHHRKVVDRFIHSVTKFEENFDQEWADSRLTVACREGYTLIYDEFTRSRPEANNVLLGILQERLLALPSGGGGEYVRVHPDFRIIFTSNSKEYAGIHSAQDALSDRMITIDMDYFDEETEISIAASRSGLSREAVTPVVKLVRGYRDSGSYHQIPTPRASLMIAKMMAFHKLNPAAHDERFFQLCLDVLEGKCVHGADCDAMAANREVIRSLIKKHCETKPARQAAGRPKVRPITVSACGAPNGAFTAKHRRVHQ